MKFNSKKWIDVVFEHRFKGYGAYEIRSNADDFQLWGLITSTLVFTVSICIYFFYTSLHQQRIDTLQQLFKDEKQVEQAGKQLPKEELKYVDVDMMALQDFLKRLPRNSKTTEVPIIPKDEVVFEKGIYKYSTDPVTGQKYDPNQSAAYPGGYQELTKHILNSIEFKKLTGNANYHYENGDDEIDYEINTMVFIQLEIDEKGMVDSVSIFKGSADPKFNDRILEAFKKSGQWQPAIHNGKGVRQTQIIPFHFNYMQPLIKFYRFGTIKILYNDEEDFRYNYPSDYNFHVRLQGKA